jgi:3-oxoacyl-[acyl-carrier protein] reductase
MSWLITGGASGIGAAIARSVAADGEDVVAWDINAPSANEFEGVQVDITDPAAVASALQNLRRPVHSVVHCAGLSVRTSVLDRELPQKMQRLYDVHVISFARIVQALAPDLVASQGSIIAITSVAMEMVIPGTAAYGPSKAGLDRFVSQLAVELGPQGVRANAIAPGGVATPMTTELWSDPERAAARRSRIPLGRQASVDEIVGVVRFLASPSASYITGSTVWVDGGVRHGIYAQDIRTGVMNDRGEYTSPPPLAAPTPGLRTTSHSEHGSPPAELGPNQ